MNKEQRREWMYPEANKAYKKWHKKLQPSDNPIIMDDPCFEHFLGGYQTALSTLPTMTEEEIRQMMRKELSKYHIGLENYGPLEINLTRALIARLPHIVKEKRGE